MATGQISKYSKNRKYSVIIPDDWGICRTDVLFNANEFEAKIGDRVEYTWVERNNRRYVESIKKIET